jgi:F-type H+-transporting ATPase subunit gamma
MSRNAHAQQNAPSSAKRIVLLAIGSERGLCGRFNASVLERAQEYLDDAQAAGLQVDLAILGTRLVRLARRAGHTPSWIRALPITSLPLFHVAFDLARQWLALYEAQSLDAVDVAYNAYRRMGDSISTVVRLLPPAFPAVAPGAREEVWPPPVVETNPSSLYARVAEQYVALRLYELLLESAAAEHSTRYQLMEAATQNASRLIEELTLAVHSARRQAITREIQELAAGAGLLGRQRR